MFNGLFNVPLMQSFYETKFVEGNLQTVNNKRVGGVNLNPWTCKFSKTVFARQRVKHCFLWLLILLQVTFFRKSSYSFLNSCRRDKNNLFFNISYFHQFFGFFVISLLQKNRSRQHITDNVSTFLPSVSLCWYRISSLWNIKGEGSNWSPEETL